MITVVFHILFSKDTFITSFKLKIRFNLGRRDWVVFSIKKTELRDEFCSVEDNVKWTVSRDF